MCDRSSIQGTDYGGRGEKTVITKCNKKNKFRMDTSPPPDAIDTSLHISIEGLNI